MNRREFTKTLAKLLTEMIESGEQPVIHYVFRSNEEQYRLFLDGKSKCDGIKIRSRHQDMLAADIYLADDNGIKWEWPQDKAIRWHNRFVELGGGPMITWDLPHFSSDGR